MSDDFSDDPWCLVKGGEFVGIIGVGGDEAQAVFFAVDVLDVGLAVPLDGINGAVVVEGGLADEGDRAVFVFGGHGVAGDPRGEVVVVGFVGVGDVVGAVFEVAVACAGGEFLVDFVGDEVSQGVGRVFLVLVCLLLFGVGQDFILPLVAQGVIEAQQVGFVVLGEVGDVSLEELG